MLARADHCLIGPDVFDGISVQVTSSVGFNFLYLIGSGATGSYSGEPDHSAEPDTLARMVVEVSDMPATAKYRVWSTSRYCPDERNVGVIRRRSFAIAG